MRSVTVLSAPLPRTIMQFHDPGSFLSFLEEHGERACVREEVDAALEITGITDRTTKGGGTR